MGGTDSRASWRIAKYHYDLVPDGLPGPFHTVEPRKIFAWKSDDSGLDHGAVFQGTVTRWRFH